MNDLCCSGEDSRRCVTVATMAKKISKSNGNRGMNSKGQTVSFEGKKVSFPAQSNVKPSEAFTSKGKMATGLSGARNPNLASKPGSKSGVASQRGYNAVNKIASTVAQTALTTAVTGAIGSVGKQATVGLAKRLGAKAFQKTGGAAWTAGSRNIAGATGAGGKVSRTMTPFGPTLRSTRIGSAEQQAARMGGLSKVYENLAVRAGKIAQTQKISSTVRTGRAATQLGMVAGATAAGTAGRQIDRRARGGAKKK